MLTSKLNLNSENKNSVETEITQYYHLLHPSSHGIFYPRSISLTLSYFGQDLVKATAPFNFITRYFVLLLSSLLKHIGFIVPSLSRH